MNAGTAGERPDALMRYLARSGPDDWHQVAWNWNWDSGVEPLRWIARQPECDRGTALLIYWMGQPGWFAQYASREQADHANEDMAVFDLLVEIERRYLDGGYMNATIAFDPADDPGTGTDWISENTMQPRRRSIPECMHHATPGRVPECLDLVEGYPDEVLAKMECG